MLFAHYGPVGEVDRICDLASARFRAWTETVSEAMERGADLEAIVELLRGESVRDVETGAAASLDLGRLETLSSIRMNALGIVRYLELRRRGGTEPPSAASRSATS